MAVLAWELYTDVKNARAGNQDNHTIDTIIRGVSLAAAAFAFTPSIHYALTSFVLMCAVYWIALDLGFNLAQKRPWWFSGSTTTTSKIDQLFGNRPVAFMAFKLMYLVAAIIAVAVPASSVGLLFWASFSVFVYLLFNHADFRWMVLQANFAFSFLIVSAIAFGTSIVINGNCTDCDFLTVATTVVPFGLMFVLIMFYKKIFTR